MSKLTYQVGNKEVEAKNFRVYWSNLSEDYTDYVQTEETMYMWAVGMCGELNIQRAVFHTKFAVQIEESRIKCVSSGNWTSVEVLDSDE
jgi:hypothetical protein